MTETQTKLHFEDVQVGDILPTLTKPPVSHNLFVRYSGASGDFNPLHTDPAVGLAGGTGGVIAHGMLIMGFLGHFVSDYLGGPLPLSRFGVRFQSMTRIGDVITCSGTVTKKYEADEAGFGLIEVAIAATDATGDKKASGSFVAKLPKRADLT